MHDCPRCQVPLHGHESFCPVCGLQQRIRSDSEPFTAGQKRNSPFGIIIVIIVLGAGLFYAVQNSWIGELIKRGPVVAEQTPVNEQTAREQFENAVIQNLAAQSATAKFIYKAGEKEVDRNYSGPVELTINTNLKIPKSRQSIIDPVKSLMVPAHINTLTFNDTGSGATATYTVSGSNTEDQTVEQGTD